MARKTLAPYGEWKSPITQDLVTGQARVFGSPRCSRLTGRLFYLENREDGSKTIKEIKGGQVHDVLPAQYSAVNTLYNYGGSPLDTLPDGRIIFSNSDETVKILDPDTGNVTDLTGNPVMRYSEFSANDKNPWVVAIEEDHTIDIPEKIEDRLVAINVDNGTINRIVQGADFYYAPEFSHDGTKIAWLEWNHPDQPWYGAKLYWARFQDGSVSSPQLVAGGIAAGVAEPRWGPDGTLYFGMEKTNYRQLFRFKPGEKDVHQITSHPDLETAEFGELVWLPGSRTYAPLSATSLVTCAVFDGICRLILIEDTHTGKFRYLAGEDEVNATYLDRITAIDENRVLGIFNGSHKTTFLKIFNVKDPAASQVIRNSIDHELPEAWISVPKVLAIKSTGAPSRTIYGFLWMPQNPDYTAPEDTLPPLIVYTHGGPTGRFGAGLSLRTQYFTTRGYAVVMLNYHGSIGYGRAYRQALWGNWGILDPADAAEVAEHLIQTGRVRKGSAGCTGISAGGYNTLQSVTRHAKTWAGAVDVSGICDLETFNSGTHKLEWNYTDALVIDQLDATPEEKRARYKERSALYHVQKIETPLLVIHGEDDTVVPMNQATDMVEALEKYGKEVRLVRVANDGHVLAKPPSAKIWLDEEEKWWRRTLL